MFGTGLPEFIVILLVVVLLFGPAMLTFWLGYLMGRTRSADEGDHPATDTGSDSDAGSKESSDE